MDLGQKKTKEEDIKREEKRLFEQFAQLGKLEITNVCQPKPPDPDIFFDYNGLTIGLEIQKIFVDNYLVQNSSKLQEADSLRNKVIELAVRKVKRHIPWPFEVHIIFNDNRINPEKIAQLSESIANIMVERLKNIEPTEDVIVFQYNNPEDELNLRSISFYISTKFDNQSFGSVASEFTRDLEPENITNAISKKEKKLENYTKNCDEVWLLIVELGSLSSICDNVQYALNLRYKTNFHKIIFLRSFKNEHYYINTVANSKK